MTAKTFRVVSWHGLLFKLSERMGAEKDLPEAERAWIIDRKERRATRRSEPILRICAQSTNPRGFQGGIPPSVAGLLPEKGRQGAKRSLEGVFPSKVTRENRRAFEPPPRAFYPPTLMFRFSRLVPMALSSLPMDRM